MIDGAALRIDDKLRVAKERREEQEKQQGGSYILFCHTCCAFSVTSFRSSMCIIFRNYTHTITTAHVLCDQCSSAWVSDSRAGT